MPFRSGSNSLQNSRKSKLVFSHACVATPLMVALSAGGLSGCASIRTVNPPMSGKRMKTYETSLTKRIVFPSSPDRTFAEVVREDVLPEVLTGYGPLPAVIGTSDRTGPWDLPGSSRIVHLADGTTVREQLTHFDAPNHFAYRVWDFGNPILGGLAGGGRGDWTFRPVSGGTEVIWTYTFTARSVVAAIPLSAVAGIFFRGYMNVCLNNYTKMLGPPPFSHE